MPDGRLDARSDAELVAAHLGGDRSALAAIYDRYADSLYDTAAAMLRDRHDAADVVQDVVVVAAQRLGQLRDASRLKPWLFAILRNEVYRRTTRRRRTVPTDFAATGLAERTAMAAAPDPDADAAAVSAAELGTLVRDAAAGLDERDQLVLELSVRQGLAGADLAAALGVSVDQSYVLLHRMRERVERSLGALTVARMGRRDCDELARLLRDWDGRFSVLVRKRVARHVDACATCERTKRAFAVIPLVGGAPALAAPPELRDRVLRAAAATSSRPPYEFDVDGFPRPASSRRRFALVVAAVLAVVLVGGLVAVGAGDSAEAPSATAPPDAAAPGTTTPTTPQPVPTTAPPTSTTTAGTTIPTTVPNASVPPPATTSPPPAVAPPTTRPATSPTTTAPAPSTTAAPRPGQLDVATTFVDLGATGNDEPVVLTNSGEQPLGWRVAAVGPAGPFRAAVTGGELAPGESAVVLFGVERGGVEGDLTTEFSVTSTGAGGGVIRVVARVERPPTVSLLAPPSVIACPTSAAPTTIRAAVTDESALASVVLSWSGPGPAGSSPMTLTGGEWRAQFGGVGNGTWTYTVTATDARGNSAAVSGSAPVVGC